MKIYFYKRTDANGYLSNFAHYSFILDGNSWKTSEHYFQASKFEDLSHIERIKTVSSPMEAAKLGRNREIPIKKDWEQIKDEIMKRAVYEKFLQNKEIQLQLLATGTAELIEKTGDDYYWGCGKNGNGKNMLGKILMEVREQLRDELV